MIILSGFLSLKLVKVSQSKILLEILLVLSLDPWCLLEIDSQLDNFYISVVLYVCMYCVSVCVQI